MKLQEYQSKELFSKYGIPVPKSVVIDTANEISEAAKHVGFPLAIKAQILVGGRGKAGGVKIANNLDEAKKLSLDILGMKIKGIQVKKVLIEEAINIKEEYYLAVTVDRDSKCNTIIFSSVGGIDIEEVAQKQPEKIVRVYMPSSASTFSQRGLEIPHEIVEKLTNLYFDLDASLAEINPLVKTRDGKFIAADAKIIIDDNALFRHPDFQSLTAETEEDEIEAEAHRRNISYVRLDGNIAVICNGAGLTMTTMDEVKRAGGNPACFLDVGGGTRRDFITNALEIVNMDNNVKGIFFNIFGGISRCDEVVMGIINASQKINFKIPIVIRLTGNREKEGRELLKQTNLIQAASMQEGAKKIVEICKR